MGCIVLGHTHTQTVVNYFSDFSDENSVKWWLQYSGSSLALTHSKLLGETVSAGTVLRVLETALHKSGVKEDVMKVLKEQTVISLSFQHYYWGAVINAIFKQHAIIENDLVFEIDSHCVV